MSNIHMRSVLATIVLLLLATGLAYAKDAKKDSIRIAEFGIFSADRGDPELSIETVRIPASKGTVFGVTVANDSQSSSAIDIRWTFPEMTNPADGRVWTEMSSSRELAGKSATPILARINHDWEAVPGDWTVQIMQNNQLVLEKVFQLTR